MKKCVLCRSQLAETEKNNPQPLRKKGKCCDLCNLTRVLPVRTGLISIKDMNKRIVELRKMKIGRWK